MSIIWIIVFAASWLIANYGWWLMKRDRDYWRTQAGDYKIGYQQQVDIALAMQRIVEAAVTLEEARHAYVVHFEGRESATAGAALSDAKQAFKVALVEYKELKGENNVYSGHK